MALFHSPKTATDGLVLMYDTGNSKSYKGEPTENLVPVGDRTLTTVLQRQSYHHATWTYSLETNINGRADVLKIYLNPTGSESSAPYADFGFQAYKSGGSQVGDVYAVSFDYYVTKSTNTPSLLVAYANGYKSPTSASAATLGTYTTTDLGNGWVRATRITTITTAGNTHWRFGLNSNYNETEVYVDNFQVELKSHATPFVDGTRSATQGLIDRTGNTTIDLSNVSFDSNAQMTFDGTDDYIDLGDLGLGSGPFTVEAVIYPTLASTYHVFFRKGDDSTSNTNMDWSMGYDYNQFHVRTQNASVSINEYAGANFVNNYGHVALTYDGSTIRMYVNGSEVSNRTVTLANNYSNYSIGRGINNYAQLDVNTLKVYNQVLTSTEVTKNFNATKSRFGL